MKLSIVVPVFNEINTIKVIIGKINEVNINKEIIIVDDCSTDGTRDILKEIKGENIKIFYHERNLGKGAALITGFSKISGDIVIIQDADLEYDPREYENLIDPILNGMADVVYGSRLIGGRPQRVHLFWHKLGNQLLSLLVGIFFNTTLTDMETGYKVFKAEVIKNLRIHSRDFSVEVELTAKILKNGDIRVYEVPISYYGRSYQEGKKITWRDGITAICAIIRFRFFD